MYWSALFSLAYGLATAVVLFFTGDWFAQFFTEDPAVIEEFSRYLAISVWGYAGFGVLIVANGALNAVDKSGLALMQSFARVFLVMLPLGWLLRDDWGAEAIYAAELLANVAGGALAAFVVWKALATKKGHIGEAQTIT
jgi:Na+-driven multidrug efflux pump